MNIEQDLSRLSDIEDEGLRKIAVLEWYNSLTPEEQREFSEYMQHVINFVQQIADGFVQLVTEASKSLLDNNPEIRQFFAQLEQSHINHDNGGCCE